MWGAVLVMALAAMVDPLRIGVTVLVISRPRPVLQLLAFWLGGLAMGLLVGLGALFLLQDVALELMRNMPAAAGGSTVGLVQIGIGVLAVLIAALIAMGFPRRSGAPQPKNSAISRLTARAATRFGAGRCGWGSWRGSRWRRLCSTWPHWRRFLCPARMRRRNSAR